MQKVSDSTKTTEASSHSEDWVKFNPGAAATVIEILRRDLQRAEEERDAALGWIDLIREFIQNA